jgi:hypothetical protein
MSVYFSHLVSRTTQADMACVAIADSSHNKFMVICLSNGASKLYVCDQTKLRHPDHMKKSQPKYGKAWWRSLVQSSQRILRLRLQKFQERVRIVWYLFIFCINVWLNWWHWITETWVTGNDRNLKTTRDIMRLDASRSADIHLHPYQLTEHQCLDYLYTQLLRTVSFLKLKLVKV